jgi:outer membrane protein assembly factor BamD (BamD/ComL family)
LAQPSTLDAEVSSLARVRASLERSDWRAALKQLDTFGRAFPSAVLADEATVLRVDALMQQGDHGAAKALALRFLASNPSSPHASHLRALVSTMHN